jgi:hypothetical protein
MSQRLLTGVFLVCAVGLVAGCNPTTMKVSWRDPAFVGPAYQNILIVTPVRHPELRRIYEDEFVRELRARGVAAEASYNYLPDVNSIRRPEIERVAKQVGAQAVIVTRFVGGGGPLVTYTADPYSGVVEADYWETIAATDMYEFDDLALRTDLVDIKSGKLVWSGTTDTTLSSSGANKQVKGVVEVLVKAMGKAAVIPPAPAP